MHHQPYHGLGLYDDFCYTAGMFIVSCSLQRKRPATDRYKTIANALEGSAIDTFWLGVSFLAASATFMPMFSTFSEIFGRKAMLVTALGFFTTGALICGLAKNFSVLHVGRGVQGIGAGGLFLLSDLITSDLVSPLDKRRWSAVIGAM